VSAPTGLSSNRITIAVVVAVACFNVLLVVWSVQTKGKRAAKASVAIASGGVLLHEPEGKRYVGDQLQFFNVSADGEISSTNVAWISLYYTEGKPFRFSGQVWLNELKGPPVVDLPDGFALFLREWDGMHRYQINTRSVDVKRRLKGGQREKGIAHAASFNAPEFGTWLSFSADVSATNLSFSIGGISLQGIEIPGPLDIDGANKIAIAPGTRLKNLRLEVGPR
jgi:hypothetical protein